VSNFFVAKTFFGGQTMPANRKYKNSVFSLVFSEPDVLRKLYSALIEN
jgi:hypothetical protein